MIARRYATLHNIYILLSKMAFYNRQSYEIFVTVERLGLESMEYLIRNIS